MKPLPLLLALLLLGACGDSNASSSTNTNPSPDGPVEGAVPVDSAPVLIARNVPLGRGELAPPFDGLPEGPASLHIECKTMVRRVMTLRHAADAPPLTIVLQRGVQIRGRVLDEDGNLLGQVPTVVGEM